jgi:hypothetical protein
MADVYNSAIYGARDIINSQFSLVMSNRVYYYVNFNLSLANDLFSKGKKNRKFDEMHLR